MSSGGDRRRCWQCQKSLGEEAVLAMSRLWHPHHFVCTGCRQPIKQTYQEKQDEPYCVPCYAEKFNPKCAACKVTLRDTCVLAQDKHWHQACFTCAQCDKAFTNGEYYLIDGRPYDLDCHWGRRLDDEIHQHGHQAPRTHAGIN